MSAAKAGVVSFMDDEPDYQMSCEEKDGYLAVRITDTSISLPDAIDYTNRLMRRFRNGGFKGVVVVRDVPLALSTTQLRILGDVIANMLPVDAKMAIVDTSDTFGKTRTIADTAQGRGRKVTAFRTEAEAVDWISGRGPDGAGPAGNPGN